CLTGRRKAFSGVVRVLGRAPSEEQKKLCRIHLLWVDWRNFCVSGVASSPHVWALPPWRGQDRGGLRGIPIYVGPRFDGRPHFMFRALRALGAAARRSAARRSG